MFYAARGHVVSRERAGACCGLARSIYSLRNPLPRLQEMLGRTPAGRVRPSVLGIATGCYAGTPVFPNEAIAASANPRASGGKA